MIAGLTIIVLLVGIFLVLLLGRDGFIILFILLVASCYFSEGNSKKTIEQNLSLEQTQSDALVP